jgi:hypothetical protein
METVQNHVSDVSQYSMHGNCYSSQYLSSKCLTYLHQQPVEWTVCARWIPHMERWPKWVFLVITHLLHCRKEGNAFLSHILMADKSWIHSINPQLKWQNAERCAQMSPRKNTAQCSQGALKVMHVSYSAEMYLCLTIPCQLIRWSMANIAAQSCRIRWGQQFTTNNQNYWNVVSFCSRTMQPLIKITMCKSVLCWGREVLAHPPYFPDPDPCDDWLFAHVEQHLWRKQCEQKMISATLLLPLYIVWEDEHRAGIDHIPHRWEKHVDSAGDYIEERTCV